MRKPINKHRVVAPEPKAKASEPVVVEPVVAPPAVVAPAKPSPGEKIKYPDDPADVEIGKEQAKISSCIARLNAVATAEGLFEPKVKDISDLAETLTAALKKRDELIKAKAEKKE